MLEVSNNITPDKNIPNWKSNVPNLSLQRENPKGQNHNLAAAELLRSGTSMAVTTIQKLLRKPPPPSIILASLRNPLLQSSNPTPPTNFPHYSETKPSENHVVNVRLFLGSFKADNLTHLGFTQFYPISPMGFLQYPVRATGSVSDGRDEDDSGMLADSVKKKRKKKMNKHKYKKLRKRMRK